MYTNGLKDRFGSPLVSQRDVEQQISQSLDTVNERIALAEENLTKVSEDLEETREEIVTEIKEDLSSKADLVLDNTFSGEQVFSNDVTFGKTIYLNNVEDPDMSTTLDGSSLSTTNVTTFTINNNDLTFTEGEIVIGNKVLTFDGEDEVIPANSVTDEARMFARVAQESAAIAEEGASVASSAAVAADTSATNASQSATVAAESAAQLGDAALKSGDNTFTGMNVFDGNTFFNGLLHGAPFWQAGGLFGNCLKGMELTEDELSAILPTNLETWWDYPMPYGQRALENHERWKSVKNAIHIIDKDIYGSGFYGLNKQLDNAVIYVTGDFYNSAFYGSNAKNTLFISPLGTGKPYNTHGVGGGVGYHENVYVYIPKANGLKYNSYPGKAPKLQSYTVLGEHSFKKVQMDMPTPCQVLKTRAGFSSATSIIISGWQLNKESVMPILENLCVYDSATMTAVPTMTISMHTDLQADEEVQAALALASTAVEEGGKGWQVTTQWNGTATASTFAPRPTQHPHVYVKREQSEDGRYVDLANVRYSIDWGHMVTSPDGKTPFELGYEEFAELENALTTWGLTEYIEVPNEEQINNN